MTLLGQSRVEYVFGGCFEITNQLSGANVILKFRSTSGSLPGTYTYVLTNPTNLLTGVVSMTIAVGGAITGASISSNNGVYPRTGSPSVNIINSFARDLTYAGLTFNTTQTVPPRNCSNTLGNHWQCGTLATAWIFDPTLVPSSDWSGNSVGTAVVKSPGTITIQPYKAPSTGPIKCGAWDAIINGPAIAAQSGTFVYTFYPPTGSNPNVPDIPPEDIPTYPVTVNNSSSADNSIQVCFTTDAGTICTGVIPPGGSTTINVPIIEPGPITPVVTPIDCPLCEYTDPPPFYWDPNDPNDPTNGGPPYVIYIPPPTVDPDPNPNPDPDPIPGPGNEGNSQGCIAGPCVIPFMYEFQSKP